MKLPSKIAQQARRSRTVPGTDIPTYRLMEILASRNGDVPERANVLNQIDEPSMRKAFQNVALLLKSLYSVEAPPTAPPRSGTSSSRIHEIAPDAEEILKQVDRIKIFVDGTSRGNPGPSAFAYIFKDVKDNVVLAGGDYIGEGTNNIAEAGGIAAALSAALHHGIKKVHVFSDSELIVKQILGKYKIRNTGLLSIHKNIQELKKQFDVFQIVKIDGASNKEADKLAHSILRKNL